MKNSIKALAIVITATLIFSGCSKGETSQSKDEDQKIKIGISQIIDHPALNASRDGFIQRLDELGIDAEIIMQDAQGDIANAQMISGKFVSDDVDLILSIATPTAQAAQNATKESKTPVIFTAVSDPVFSGLLKNAEAPEGNITGVTDEVSIENRRLMFEILKEIDPTIKSVGVLFNTGESNSQVQIEDIEKIAREFDIKIEKVGIAAIVDISQAIESISKKSDALMLINDNMVASSMELIAKTAKEKGLISISGDSSHVDSGALISVGVSYFDLGVQAADMAKSILVDKISISKIPVEISHNFIKKVNTQTMNSLDLDKNIDAFKDAEFTQ